MEQRQTPIEQSKASNDIKKTISVSRVVIGIILIVIAILLRIFFISESSLFHIASIQFFNRINPDIDKTALLGQYFYTLIVFGVILIYTSKKNFSSMAIIIFYAGIFYLVILNLFTPRFLFFEYGWAAWFENSGTYECFRFWLVTIILLVVQYFTNRNQKINLIIFILSLIGAIAIIIPNGLTLIKYSKQRALDRKLGQSYNRVKDKAETFIKEKHRYPSQMELDNMTPENDQYDNSDYGIFIVEYSPNEQRLCAEYATKVKRCEVLLKPIYPGDSEVVDDPEIRIELENQAVDLVDGLPDVSKFFTTYSESYTDVDYKNSTNTIKIIRVYAIEGGQTIEHGWYKVNVKTKEVTMCNTASCK